MKKIILLMLTVALLLPAAVFAQSATTGAFSGNVIEHSF